MLTAVATVGATGVAVTVGQPVFSAVLAVEEVPEKDLNPIFPELKEVVWGFGSFIVFAVVLRYLLFPKLRKGMDDRYNSIRGGHEAAERVTDEAREAVARYEAQLASIRGEAQQRIEAARATLEAERSEQLAAVNTRIADKRAAAATQAEQVRQSAQADVDTAVRSVAARVGELVTGRAPDPRVVDEAVAAVTSAGVAR